MPENKIIIAGGSGFIGRSLARYYAVDRGWTVIVLSRAPAGADTGAAEPGRIRELLWDAVTVGPWAAELENAAVVVNLTGKSISCRHTPENRRAILKSRVDSVNAVATAIQQSRIPPACLIQAGATGFYGNSGDTICTEQFPAGTGFLAETCTTWEAALHSAAIPGTRKVILRIGLVLGPQGGLLAPVAKLARAGLGGAVGSGRQWMSWIHLRDIVHMVGWLADHAAATGTYNGTAPAPTTNRNFMATLRKVLHRPWSPPAPAFAVRIGSAIMGIDGDLALTGCRAVPQRFLESGFAFEFPELLPALTDCLQNKHPNND